MRDITPCIPRASLPWAYTHLAGVKRLKPLRAALHRPCIDSSIDLRIEETPYYREQTSNVNTNFLKIFYKSVFLNLFLNNLFLPSKFHFVFVHELKYQDS